MMGVDLKALNGMERVQPGDVAPNEIESATDVMVVAFRHQREDDCH
jgi:hypothetical protein